MERFRQTLIEVGHQLEVLPEDAEARIRSVPQAYYQSLAKDRYTSLGFLAALGFEDAFAFVRALARAEKLKLCPFPGSTSLLIPAYAACRGRIVAEAAEIADWIVKNHDNPYTPFNFRRTRIHWERAAQGSRSAMETLERVRELERHEAHAKARRAERHEVADAIQHLLKGDSPPAERLRDRIVEELEREIDDRQAFPDSK